MIKVLVMRSRQGSTPPAPLCRTLPKPLAFGNTLPKRIQDELSSLESLIEEHVKVGGPVRVFDLFVVVFSVIVFVLSLLLTVSQSGFSLRNVYPVKSAGKGP